MSINRLSERERQLIACLELNASMTAQEVAKGLGWQTHVAQYTINKLEDLGVIRKSVFIDIYRLGLRYCAIFFSARASEVQQSKLFHYANSHRSVAWFAELGGVYNYGIALAVNSPMDAEKIFYDLTKNCAIEVYKKTIAFRLSITDTPRQYLSNKAFNSQPITAHDGVDLVNIDEIDKTILSKISVKPEFSHRAIAKELGMAHTSFELRVRQLRNRGVIKGTTLELDLNSLGRSAHKLLIYVKQKDEKLTKDFLDFVVEHPLASHFVDCFGEWDYEINIEVESPLQVSKIQRDIISRFANRTTDIIPLSILNVRRVSRYPG